MSQHCQHSSRAEPCAIFAYLVLACSECHELFNHEASLRNYGACLSAASDEEEFRPSAFADVKMLQFHSSLLVPTIFRMALSYMPERQAKSQNNCGSGGMLYTATRAQMAPPHGYRQPSFLDSIWSLPGAHGRFFLLLLLCYYMSLSIKAQRDIERNIRKLQVLLVMNLASFVFGALFSKIKRT
jgi:hypothetical protein